MSKVIIAILLATIFFCYQASAVTLTYTYDNLNRLKKMDYGNGMTIEYTYDAAGNRLTLLSVGDITTPDTTITSQPLNPTNSTSASFEFTSTETGSTFQCQMDSGGYSACTSPKSYTALTTGSHTFYVKATDSAGNTDATPASYTWMIDTTAPTGSITINGGDTYTNSTSVTLTLSATDNVGVTGYYISTTPSTPSSSASGWILVTSSASYSASVSYTLSIGDGNKTVYVWFKDEAGNVSYLYSDSIILDTTPPTLELNPVTSPTNINTQTITGTVEAGAIVKVAVNDLSKYASASVNGTTWSYKITGLAEGTNNIYVAAMDIAGNTTLVSELIKVDTTSPVTNGNSINFPSDDTGIKGISRVDGGNDSNNINASENKPKGDIEYKFAIVLKDPSGNPPKFAKLYMTQRANPKTTDFYNYDMTCEGDITTGATCSFITKLGPANVYKYHFEAKFADGTDMRFPETGEIEGPEVGLLTGYNMVGIPRDLSGTALDGISAFGSVSSYGWVSSGLTTDKNKGDFVLVNSTNPVKGGEGYFTKKESGVKTLPEHGSYNDISDTNYIITLRPGWNIISNPYGGNVNLSSVKVQKGSDTPIAWIDGAKNKNGWIENAIYFYNGSDWRSTYTIENSGGVTEAFLVPWMGYWVYVRKDDDTYKLVIPKPK